MPKGPDPSDKEEHLPSSNYSGKCAPACYELLSCRVFNICEVAVMEQVGLRAQLVGGVSISELAVEA